MPVLTTAFVGDEIAVLVVEVEMAAPKAFCVRRKTEGRTPAVFFMMGEGVDRTWMYLRQGAREWTVQDFGNSRQADELGREGAGKENDFAEDDLKEGLGCLLGREHGRLDMTYIMYILLPGAFPLH